MIKSRMSLSYTDYDINKDMKELTNYYKMGKGEIIKRAVKKELYKVNQKINKTL